MNKQLQEFYLVASEQFKIVQDQGLPAPYQTRAFAEKFAELIVRECAKIAEKEQAFNARYTDADKHPQVNIDQCILIEFGL